MRFLYSGALFPWMNHSGWGSRQLETTSMPQNPLKLFKVLNAKPIYSGSLLPFPGNLNKAHVHEFPESRPPSQAFHVDSVELSYFCPLACSFLTLLWWLCIMFSLKIHSLSWEFGMFDAACPARLQIKRLRSKLTSIENVLVLGPKNFSF